MAGILFSLTVYDNIIINNTSQIVQMNHCQQHLILYSNRTEDNNIYKGVPSYINYAMNLFGYMYKYWHSEILKT